MASFVAWLKRLFRVGSSPARESGRAHHGWVTPSNPITRSVEESLREMAMAAQQAEEAAWRRQAEEEAAAQAAIRERVAAEEAARRAEEAEREAASKRRAGAA